jgi:hypothetical protein
MRLAEFQTRFQSAALGAQDPEFLAQLAPPARADTIDELFAVYRDGYPLRMAECLAQDYPTLREAFGDEIFADIVRAYVAAHPSHFRNARWIGAALPEFLRATPPFADNALACGLAALEAALSLAFDAADATPLPIEILGATPEEDWPRLRFGFHPSLVLAEANGAALAVYEAAQKAETVDPSRLDEAALPVLVWRDGLTVRYRPLEELEALALREARAGAGFGEICALLAFARPDEAAEQVTLRAAGFLANWFAGGLIVAAAP